jgi:hypothetical protein
MRIHMMEVEMQTYIVKVLATRTFMGNDDWLFWTYSVPASSSKAATDAVWRLHPDVARVEISAVPEN